MSALYNLPALHIALTFLVYAAASALFRRFKVAVFHPVLVTILTLIVLLRVLGIDYETYNRGGRFISVFLGPAVVALGLPLYQQWDAVRKNARAVASSMVFGSVVGVVAAVVPLIQFGVPHEVIVSVAPKSVTTPIAMAITAGLGGNESLSAGVVVVTGLIGAVIGPPILKLIGIGQATAFGLAMGAGAHGIGTARALEWGPVHGAAAGLAICLNGIMTALVTPPLVRLLLTHLG